MNRFIRSADFKQEISARRTVLGTFVRSAVPSQIEILALAGLDYVCLDAEHGVFDRAGLDHSILAARAHDMPLIVRVPGLKADAIGQALDMGAAGVMVPHIRSIEDAQALALWGHYGPGGRGFATSPRAAAYGLTPARTIRDLADRGTVLIAMLEDPEPFDFLDEIMAIKELDAFFLGMSDLSVALGVDSQHHSQVLGLVDAACAAARRHGKALGMVLRHPQDAPSWIEKGASFFLIGSEQSMIMAGALQMRSEFLTSIGGQ